MEPDFDVDLFEKKLLGLKDTQDSIQSLSAWCLKHHTAHKKIVNSWLSVLKSVKIEQRLTLFYLANDVIQHSKRKNYEFVDSWSTSLQRATTLVREDDRVKSKILRVFKIWGQRSIYSEEFLTDLYDLLKITPTVKKSSIITDISPTKDCTGSQESDDFQVTAVVSNIRNCVKLEKSTDTNFKIVLKSNVPDVDHVKHTLKDRSQVEDAEREADEGVKRYEKYITSLKAEIKARKILLTALDQAEEFYKIQRGEVKTVANAYKNFGNRIKSMKKKLDELSTTLPSPLPSPTFDAPSPEPDNDNDFDLPDTNFYNASMNGFSSYVNSGVPLPFDINDFTRESPPPIENRSKVQVQSIEVISSRGDESSGAPLTDFYKSLIPSDPFSTSSNSNSFSYGSTSYGLPPPQPPLPPPSMGYHGTQSHVTSSRNPTMNTYAPPPPPPLPMAPPMPHMDPNDEYDPWTDMPWNSSQESDFDLNETPVSPPHYDKIGLNDGIIEYVDNNLDMLNSGEIDVHPDLILPKHKDMVRVADIDHRNLISLTGSPNQNSSKPAHNVNKMETSANQQNRDDQDYRSLISNVQMPKTDNDEIDYRRTPSTLLPPPPLPLDMDQFLNDSGNPFDSMPAPMNYPPPRHSNFGKMGNQRNRNNDGNSKNGSGKDNDESIDMDISDEMSDDDTFGDDIDNPEYYDDNDEGSSHSDMGKRESPSHNEDRQHNQQQHHMYQQRKSWPQKNNQNGNEDRNQNEWTMPPPGQGLLGMAPPNYMPMNMPPRPFNNFRGNMNRGGPKRGMPFQQRGGGINRGMNRGGFRNSPYRGGGFKGNNNFRGGF